jgi:hypothetical protein
MNHKEFDLAANKFTLIAMGLAVIYFFSLLVKIIFLDFEGIDVYWIIAAILSFLLSWLLLSRIITKRLSGFGHIIIIALGLLFLLFIDWYVFFSYFLTVLFFLIMIGLFTSIFIDWQNGLRRTMLISSAVYLFLLFLPISSYGGLYLKELFYWNFVNYSPDIILYWIPLIITILILLEWILTTLNKLPDKIQPKLIHRLNFFTGLVYLAYYLIRQPAYTATYRGFSGFVGNFFAQVFIYSLCLILCMGVFELAENKLGKPLSMNVEK